MSSGPRGGRRGRLQPRIAVFCSGQGTNLQAILTAIRRGRLQARVAAVVSDNPGAPALVRAARAGIPAIVVDRRRFASRERFDRALLAALKPLRVRLVVLAGFMRILSPRFIRSFPNRILNVHPALLPAFRGAHAVREALAAGVRITGVTVHFVDEQVDHGPVIAQAAVPVRPDDTEATLLARVHRVEHRLYPRAIDQVLRGKIRTTRKGRS
ncbi:MAG: phosphoribosylglycinamide formyltransferase [Candidatus Omnitrophica bacterium CG11_big_fil_rev_8_21_14_0_20_64_10]|nr:MAG: phosphoribosylglycinamide formyltransferase [Candidatus Omnitrophica bacterium CG11_big_fil_rev_8_21_14_0_20_64_10]